MLKQEKLSSPSADMICGRPSGFRASLSGVDSNLGLIVVRRIRPALQSVPEPDV